MVAATVLNKQSKTAGKVWPSGLGGGGDWEGLTVSQRKKLARYRTGSCEYEKTDNFLTS